MTGRLAYASAMPSQGYVKTLTLPTCDCRYDRCGLYEAVRDPG